MTKQVCDGMVERGWGRIINISSVNGQKGAFGQTNYSAAKAGMHGFTKALALEVARKGVTVNTISPGYIGTKMVMAIPKDVLDSQDHSADPDGPARQAGGSRGPGRLPVRRTRRRSSPAPTSRSTAASTCSSGRAKLALHASIAEDRVAGATKKPAAHSLPRTRRKTPHSYRHAYGIRRKMIQVEPANLYVGTRLCGFKHPTGLASV